MFWCSIPGEAYSFGLLAIIEFSFVTSPRCTLLKINKKAPNYRGFFISYFYPEFSVIKQFID